MKQTKQSKITLIQGQLADGTRFWSSRGIETCDSCGRHEQVSHGGPTEIIALGYFLYARDVCTHQCFHCSRKRISKKGR